MEVPKSRSKASELLLTFLVLLFFGGSQTVRNNRQSCSSNFVRNMNFSWIYCHNNCIKVDTKGNKLDFLFFWKKIYREALTQTGKAALSKRGNFDRSYGKIKNVEDLLVQTKKANVANFVATPKFA